MGQREIVDAVYRAEYPNHVCSYDFVFDQTEDGWQLKCLTAVDEFSRLGLAIQLGRSLTAHDVTRILDELFRQHGSPVCIRSDNGPELVSKHVQKWLKEKNVDTHYIDPGSPGRTATARASIRSFKRLAWIVAFSVH